MSRYKNTGRDLDDVYIEDGDNHFIGMDSRVHPTLLKKGMVTRSENQRFDDLNATTRKGIERISDDILIDGTALTLPFGTGGTIPISSIEYNTERGEAFVHLAVAPNPPIPQGESMLITGSDRPEFNRLYNISVISPKLLGFIPVGGPTNGVSGLFEQTSVGPTDGTTNSYDADALLVVGQDYIILDYETGDDFSNVGGPASAPGTTHDGVVFTCTAEKPASFGAGTILKRQSMSFSGLLGMVTDGAFDTTLFSDVETNKEYVAMATATQVLLIDPDDSGNPIYIPYESGIVVEPNEEASIIQVNNGLLIHRGKRFKAIEWDGNVVIGETIPVFEVSLTSNVVTVTTVEAHGYHVGDTVIVAGADDAFYNGTHVITLITEDTYTYAVTNADDAGSGGSITSKKVNPFVEVKDSHLAPNFLSMPKAEFSVYHPFARLVIPVRILELDIDVSLISTGTTAVATTTYAHGLQIGDRVTITGSAIVGHNGIKEITGLTTDIEDPLLGKTFSYAITGPVGEGGANIVCEIDVRDQFIISDFYDHRTYDPVNNLFRVNRGGADSLMAILVYQDDNIIALYEKSIHVLSGVSESELSDSFVRQVTSEVGCIARRTAVIIGNHMIFLSSHGVYMLEITTELNLRGVDVPLSFDIQDEFRALNYDYISKAVAVYFNNRYYIAVPSKFKDDGVTVNTRNNIVFVYNFLNKKWESKDTFAGGVNYIDNWTVCKKDGQDRLFASSLEGALQLWEEAETDEVSLIEGASFTNEEIVGRITTRRYIGDSISSAKKFNRATVNYNVGVGDEFTITAITENPETSVQILSEVSTVDQDKHKRKRINKRGTGVQLDIISTVGRPTMRSVTVESTETQGSNKNFE